MILLDTNVISAVMAPAPQPAVLRWLDEQHADTLFVSTVTIAEIAYGIDVMSDGKRRHALAARFDDFVARGFAQRVLPFDVGSALEYGKIMANRRGIGRPMSVPDGQIAAIARTHGMAIATRNLRDFEDCGLELIDPFASAALSSHAVPPRV
jgi:predicted nucleic acid-binding protein